MTMKIKEAQAMIKEETSLLPVKLLVIRSLMLLVVWRLALTPW